MRAILVRAFFGCEHPVDAGAALVSLPLPGGDFAHERVLVGDSPVKTLGAQDADLDLDQVEPTGVLGGVMELEPPQDAPCFWGRECPAGRAAPRSSRRSHTRLMTGMGG